MSISVGNGWHVKEDGNTPVVELMTGWRLELLPDGRFQIVNRTEEGKRRFYAIEAGPYSPIIIEEPENAVAIGINDYVDTEGKPAAASMRIKGIIVKSAPGTAGKILYRGNLTNFLDKDSGTIEEDGKFVVLNGARHRLYRLVAENKSRIQGYIGFYLPEDAHDGSAVQISEIEDLA